MKYTFKSLTTNNYNIDIAVFKKYLRFFEMNPPFCTFHFTRIVKCPI